MFLSTGNSPAPFLRYSMFCSNSDAQTRVTVWLHFAEDSLYYQMLHSVSEHDSRHSVMIHSIERETSSTNEKKYKKGHRIHPVSGLTHRMRTNPGIISCQSKREQITGHL